MIHIIPIGIGLVYGSYCGVLWGMFLVTGKNVGVKQLFGKTWPPDVPGVPSSSGAAGTQTATAPTGGAAGQGTNKPFYPTPSGNAPSNLATQLGITTGG